VKKRPLLMLLTVCACGGAASPHAPGSPAPSVASARDTASRLVPAGFGSLKQDEVALRLQTQALQLKAIPLDESVIRVLSPDSYRALHGIVTSQHSAVQEVARRTGVHEPGLWYISFSTSELGETRFSPMELVITSVGRDFRPIEVIPLTPGFGSQRLRQREVQSALYVFDAQLDVNQPLTLQYENVRSTEWPTILERIERERVMVRSRARS
jgi:hypothetical protein